MSNSMIDTYFTGITQAWVKEILTTERSFCFQAYLFTSAPIAKALLQIHKEGKKVMAIFDAALAFKRGSRVRLLADANIPVWLDDKHKAAHNKVGIKDELIVLTGSFNPTHYAEVYNAENTVILRVKKTADAYLKNFHEHQDHSVLWKNVTQARSLVPKRRGRRSRKAS